ncbi:hypothetical protein SAMN05192551_1148 [Tindallia magadiensis]|uniref:Uncharacterized protein n=1 Tax=Tindallia magadiensis TaxID=69895 RepID=A0A1I3HLE1_9FIRM|nr:hypothetical protein [Tindallia magadiensis]SFI36598.1 hypothetical protein SAMN05192551_1148 [Tindallia magadiensis]
MLEYKRSKNLKTSLSVFLIICLIMINAVSIYAVDDDWAIVDEDGYTFIENIATRDDIEPMDDPVTIRRGDDGSLQSITFQVNSTGGASARFSPNSHG